MRALVIFESMFGNTEHVARAIADGLNHGVNRVDVVEVGHAPAVAPVDVALLVVGGPTHAFGMSRPRSRRSAAKRANGPLVSQGIGVREWLDRLEYGSGGAAAAAFDTMVERPRWIRWFGSAGRGIEKYLRGRGFPLAVPVEHFLVTGATGPLVDGEVERARRWGESLALSLPATGRRAA